MIKGISFGYLWPSILVWVFNLGLLFYYIKNHEVWGGYHWAIGCAISGLMLLAMLLVGYSALLQWHRKVLDELLDDDDSVLPNVNSLFISLPGYAWLLITLFYLLTLVGLVTTVGGLLYFLPYATLLFVIVTLNIRWIANHKRKEYQVLVEEAIAQSQQSMNQSNVTENGNIQMPPASQSDFDEGWYTPSGNADVSSYQTVQSNPHDSTDDYAGWLKGQARKVKLERGATLLSARYVMRFELHEWDEYGNQLPPIRFKMGGKELIGSISEGDTILIDKNRPRSNKLIKIRSFYNTSRHQKVYMERGFIGWWLLVLLVIGAGVVWILDLLN